MRSWQFPDNLLYILFITSVKESLCARNPRDLLRHLLADPPGGEQSWEGFLFFSSAYFFFFLPYLRRWSNKWFRNNLTLENICHHLIPPQIVVTNSLPQGLNVARMGSKLEVIDISGETFSFLFFSSWFGFQGMVSEFIRRSHYNESVGKARFYFNRFQISSVKGERPLWPLLQADRQGGGEQGEENQRRRNFLFFIQCHLKSPSSFLVPTTAGFINHLPILLLIKNKDVYFSVPIPKLSTQTLFVNWVSYLESSWSFDDHLDLSRITLVIGQLLSWSR